MYRVYVQYGGAEYPLYEPLDDDTQIFEPVLTEEVGSAGSFQFRIYRGHVNYGKLRPCKSEIILYQDQEEIFRGRMLKPEQDFNNLVTITCEGELTYLLDSIQRPATITGDIPSYLSKLLEVHNGQVDEDKQVLLGRINVTSDGANIERTISGYTPTLTILRQLPEEYGGYLRIRRDDGKRYLDYVWDYGGINAQVIRFGENLLDLTKHVDASGIITCLIPQGGEVEYEDELGETQTRTVDITSVNGGLDYITAEKEILDQYGKIWGYQKFENVTSPELLLKKAKAYLEETSALPESIDISAVDLALINADIEHFKAGYWTNVASAPHGIEQRYMLSRRVINLIDPTQGSITLGREISTMTGNSVRNQAAISDRIEKITESTSEEINRKVENATTLITGGFGGYVVLDNIDPATGKKMYPWRILVMNTPDKETARNIIQINQNGIGFSTTGINGPYLNAWTIDGNLVADFITTGTMLADRIRGGTLEVGGSGLGKDGVIRVLDKSGKEIMRMDVSGVEIKDGKLSAPEIRGGSADFGSGLFTADDDMVTVGGFEARYDWGRDIFQSYDGMCGLSANPDKKGGLWAWFGWNSSGDFDIVINNAAQVVAKDFVVDGDFELAEKIHDIEDRLEQLEDDISNMG